MCCCDQFTHGTTAVLTYANLLSDWIIEIIDTMMIIFTRLTFCYAIFWAEQPPNYCRKRVTKVSVAFIRFQASMSLSIRFIHAQETFPNYIYRMELRPPIPPPPSTHPPYTPSPFETDTFNCNISVWDLGHHRFCWWAVACLASSNYLKQYWLILDWNTGNKLRIKIQGFF